MWGGKAWRAWVAWEKKARDYCEEVLSHSRRWEKLVWKILKWEFSIYFSHGVILIANSLFPWCYCLQNFSYWIASLSRTATSFSSSRKGLIFHFPFHAMEKPLLWLLNSYVGIAQGILRGVLLLLTVVLPSSPFQLEWAIPTSQSLCTGLPPAPLLWVLNY